MSRIFNLRQMKKQELIDEILKLDKEIVDLKKPDNNSKKVIAWAIQNENGKFAYYDEGKFYFIDYLGYAYFLYLESFAKFVIEECCNLNGCKPIKVEMRVVNEYGTGTC